VQTSALRNERLSKGLQLTLLAAEDAFIVSFGHVIVVHSRWRWSGLM
jgi:hypothetical protein